jgi:hypothetical protein
MYFKKSCMDKHCNGKHHIERKERKMKEKLTVKK